MKKILKTFLALTVTWTLAEFVTTWRLQPTRKPLKQFTKSYFSVQKAAFKDSMAVGETFIQNPRQGVKDIGEFAFTKYPL